jgi:hypothetical protein
MDLNKVADQLVTKVENQFTSSLQRFIENLLNNLNIKQYGIIGLIGYLVLVVLLVFIAWKVRNF